MHFIAGMLRVYECGTFYHMRQLKHQSHRKSHCSIGHKITDSPWSPSNHGNRDRHVKHDIQYFSEPENDVLLHIEMLQGCTINRFTEVLFEVGYQSP